MINPPVGGKRVIIFGAGSASNPHHLDLVGSENQPGVYLIDLTAQAV